MQKNTTERLDKLRTDLLYCPETGIFTWMVARNNVKIGMRAGCRKSNGYEYIMFEKTMFLSHRLAWFYITGEFPKDEIDHINTIKTDNRFVNLRECTKSQNQSNTAAQKNNKSGFKGVSWHKKSEKYYVRIMKDTKSYHLGYFEKKIDAAEAYNKKALELFGEFAYKI